MTVKSPLIGCMLLSFLVLPVAVSASGEAVPASPKGAGRFLVWWHEEKLCAELGITPELRQELAARLDALQTSYQIAQTQLWEGRRQQSAMFLDPTVDAQKLAELNRTQVAVHSDRLQALNFEARLFVRGRLSQAQLTKLASSHPQFFSARWFKSSRVPVLEGKVIEEE